MSTADHLKALNRSHADTRFYAIAMQMAVPSADARSAQGDER